MTVTKQYTPAADPRNKTHVGDHRNKKMEADANPFSRLRETLDTEQVSATESWKPEVGDELAGIFEGYSRGTTRKGETFPIANVRREDGTTVAVWGFYTVLRDELSMHAPAAGEPLMIKRFPDQQSRTGNTYRVYRVATLEQADPFAGTSEPLDHDWIEAEGGAE